MMDKEIVIEILEAYNEAMADRYNEILMAGELPANLEMSRMDSLEKIVEHKMIDWMKLYSNEDLSGYNLYQYLEEKADLHTARTFLINASYICDNGIPVIMYDLFARWKQKLAPELVDYLLSHNWGGQTSQDAFADDIITSVAALLDTLAVWLDESLYKRLLCRYMDTKQPFDIISDGFKTVTKQLGLKQTSRFNQIIIEVLQAQIIQIDNLNTSGEHVLIALVSYQRGNADNQVLDCVKQCLYQMKDKQLPIICLADLEDSRGIPVLREWLKTLAKENLNETWLKEAVASLKRLGDDTTDLEAQYKLGEN